MSDQLELIGADDLVGTKPSKWIHAHELAFSIALDLGDVLYGQESGENNHSNKLAGLPLDLLQEMVKENPLANRLYFLGDYEIREMVDGSSLEKRIINMAEIAVMNNRAYLLLPKGKLSEVKRILNNIYRRQLVLKTNPPIEADLDAIFKEFPNPSPDPQKVAENPTVTPEDLQIRNMGEILVKGHGGVIEYAMGGGKTFFIAMILAAYQNIRPVLVTGSARQDTAQLAIKLSIMLGEKICLLGCAGAIKAGEKKKHLVKNWRDASIVVATHNVMQKIGNVDSAADQNDDDEPSDIRSFLLTVPFFIADEVHSLSTPRNIECIRQMNPRLCFGLTGTWLNRFDKADFITGDMLSLEGAKHPLCKVKHQNVATSGRVVPLELYGYMFTEAAYPLTKMEGRRRYHYTLNQEKIQFHDGRNRMCGELCDHLLKTNERDGRGTIMVFVKSIEHGTIIMQHICAIRGIAFDIKKIEEHGLMLHNAQLSNGVGIDNVDAIKQGKVKLVITTDTLSTGFDTPYVYDTFDPTGMKDSNKNLQRSGRAVRQDSDGKMARYHTIIDTHEDLFKQISYAKIRVMESYYDRKAQIFEADKIPWTRSKHNAIDDDAIFEALEASGFDTAKTLKPNNPEPIIPHGLLTGTGNTEKPNRFQTSLKETETYLEIPD